MIYIVSGFFRSGTSMMMQALEAGGLPVYYSRHRDEFNERHTDISRRPNPLSLYEPSGTDLAEIGFPRQHDGKAVKVLIGWPLAVHDYRVVVMRRDPEAIIASYERNFKNFWDNATRNRWIAKYPARLDEAIWAFENRRDVRSCDLLDFEQMLENPLRKLQSLGWPIDCVKAARTVVKQCAAA